MYQCKSGAQFCQKIVHEMANLGQMTNWTGLWHQVPYYTKILKLNQVIHLPIKYHDFKRIA